MSTHYPHCARYLRDNHRVQKACAGVTAALSLPNFAAAAWLAFGKAPAGMDIPVSIPITVAIIIGLACIVFALSQFRKARITARLFEAYYPSLAPLGK